MLNAFCTHGLAWGPCGDVLLVGMMVGIIAIITVIDLWPQVPGSVYVRRRSGCRHWDCRLGCSGGRGSSRTRQHG